MKLTQNTCLLTPEILSFLMCPTYKSLIKVCGGHCHLSCLDFKTTNIERHQSLSFYEVFGKYCCSVAQSCPTLCDPMDCSMPGFPVLQHLGELAQILVRWVGDAIQPCPCHPLLLLPSSFPSIRVFSNDPFLFLENTENYKEGNEWVTHPGIKPWTFLFNYLQFFHWVSMTTHSLWT